MTYKTVLILVIALIAICVLLIILIIAQKYHQIRKNKNDVLIQSLLTDRYSFNKEVVIKCSVNAYVRNFFVLSQKIKFRKKSLDLAYAYFIDKNVIKKLNRNLTSSKDYKRVEAITYLSLFKNDETKNMLTERLLLEQKENIKILIVNGLKNDINKPVLQAIVTSLITSRRYYQERVIKILKKYINQSYHDLSKYFNSPLMEIKEAFVDLATQIFHPSFEEPLKETLKEIEEHYQNSTSLLLKNLTKHRIDRIYHQTLLALSRYYGLDLSSSKYIAHNDDEVVKIAVNSMVTRNDFKTIEFLLSYASQTSRDVIFSEAIEKICITNRNFYKDLYELFKSGVDERKQLLISGILSNKIDYLFLTIKNIDELSLLISSMVRSRYSINIINWLNSNKNIELEDSVLEIITPIADDNYDFYLELNAYLRKRIFKKMGFTQAKFPNANAPNTDPETNKTKWLSFILVFLIIFLPILFVLTRLNFIFNSSFLDIIKNYIVTLNKWFIIYYVFVNFLYILFAFISLFEYKKQDLLWKIKNEDFLYENGIIAPISIIVPAYNEELTIVESLRSLLSLRYPNYEVIVVNDGSHDQTLKTLVEKFELKRVNYNFNELIHTMPVKAVYKNKFYTKLTVIDKENGGKADSLNVGINFSKNSYVCGIDADSLIEPSGLLRMMSSVLDYDSITLALGGSIVPVNGATVDHGLVTKYRLPKSQLARFQTIEYIRAFNAGRLGFSRMKCFLIVSGAFGLFEKRMLVEVGGYLTASSFRKDTVGEDMELVVRIARKASESNLDYRISYIPTARCYTEVPEESKSLLSQRNRWQKGLIDTLSYHRKMIFNRRYGTNGTIAMPYFFIFEMLAPVLELQIYTSIIAGLFFGIFDGVFILLLIVLTTFLGMFVSLISLYLQEKYTEPLTVKDILVLIFNAIIENLGWRQFMSLYRSLGYFTSFGKKHEWGKMSRVGFKK